MILYVPPERTNLLLILLITIYYYLPGGLNLQLNCLLVVLVPIIYVLHLPSDNLKVMLIMVGRNLNNKMCGR